MSVEALGKEQLSLVSQLVLEFDRLSTDIARLEAEAGAKRADLERVTTQRLPAAMQDLELTEVKLADGSRITVKPEYHCSIPKAKKDEAMQWLRDNELGDVIKTFVSAEFGRGEDALAIALTERLRVKFPDRPVLMEAGVHASTLKALVKERFESGNPLPEELFGIFIIDRAIIKKATL